jgi:hypothetical protein
MGKCITHVPQWHVIELLKLGLLPLRAGNYYLIKAEVLDELFRTLDFKAGLLVNLFVLSLRRRW